MKSEEFSAITEQQKHSDISSQKVIFDQIYAWKHWKSHLDVSKSINHFCTTELAANKNDFFPLQMTG